VSVVGCLRHLTPFMCLHITKTLKKKIFVRPSAARGVGRSVPSELHPFMCLHITKTLKKKNFSFTFGRPSVGRLVPSAPHSLHVSSYNKNAHSHSGFMCFHVFSCISIVFSCVFMCFHSGFMCFDLVSCVSIVVSCVLIWFHVFP